MDQSAHEEGQWHDQNRCIQVFTAVVLGKTAAFFVPASGHHFFAITLAHPLCAFSWKSEHAAACS
jgi:hypothetical protein